MKKTLLAILTLVTFQAWGQNLALSTEAQWLAFLSPEQSSVIEQKGEYLDSGTTIDGLQMATVGPWANREAVAWTGRTPTVTAELLKVIPDKNASLALPDRLLAAFNAMNAVSTMTGTQYWSTVRKDWETLILDSYLVESPEHHEKMSDETFTAIPDSLRLTVFQKNNKLGDGYTEITINKKVNGFFVTMNNINPLNYMFVTLVQPRQFQMTFDITFLKDKIVIFTVMGAKTIQFLGLEHSKDKSFRNRMEALAGWFSKQL